MRNLKIGDIVICINDERTLHLTKNKQYEVLDVHESITTDILVQLLDDCNEIYSFEKPRFITLEQYREQQIGELF